MSPVLQLRNLRKSYGALKVTDDVSLDVARGELHAIIGPNGAGKTTLIHQISGSAPSDDGRILFDGEDVTALAMHQRVARGLARSFQITSILPGFTALENVAMAVQAREGTSFIFFGDPAREDALTRPAMEALAIVKSGGARRYSRRRTLAWREAPARTRRRARHAAEDAAPR